MNKEFLRSFIPPKDFLKIFSGIDHAPLLFHGNINQDFVRSVQDSTLEGMTFEGVVCKGAKTKTGPGMFKIKSKSWLDALLIRCDGDSNLFEKLA